MNFHQALVCCLLLAPAVAPATETVTLPVGAEVTLRPADGGVVTLTGPAELTVVGRRGRLYELSTPDGQQRGYVAISDLRRLQTSGDQRTRARADTLLPAHGLYDRMRQGGRLTFSQGSSAEVETFLMEFSPDGRYLALGERNIATRSALNVSTFRGATSRNKQAITRLIDLRTGVEARRLVGHPGAHRIVSISFSPDSVYATTSGYTSNSSLRGVGVPVAPLMTTKVWRVDTGEELFHLEKVKYAAFSPDGQTLVTYGGATLATYDAAELEQKRALQPRWEINAGGDPPAAPVISGDSQTVFVIGGKTVYALTLADGAVRQEFVTARQCNALACSADGSLLATAYRDTVVLWDAKRGRELRRIDLGEPATRLHCGPRGEVLFTADTSAIGRWWNVQTGDVVRATPEVGSTMAVAPSGRVLAVEADDADGYVELIDAQTYTPLARVNQYDAARTFITEVNTGRYVSESNGAPLLVEGVENSAEDVAEAFASIPFAPTDAKPSRPAGPAGSGRRVYVLAVGVSDYKYDEYDLNVAAADARDLAGLFRSRDGQPHNVVVQVYADRQATQASVNQGLSWLQQSCGERDIAVVSFAGHAIRGRNGLYFMTHEADAESMQSTCLNWTKVAKQITELGAGTTVVLTDCCHAGDFGTRGRPSQVDIARAFQQKAGLFMLASSSGDQPSYEDLGNGLFTASVLEALHGAADANRDGAVSIGELRDHVVAGVRTRTSGRQVPEVTASFEVDLDTTLVTTPSASVKSQQPGSTPVAPAITRTGENR